MVIAFFARAKSAAVAAANGVHLHNGAERSQGEPLAKGPAAALRLPHLTLNVLVHASAWCWPSANCLAPCSDRENRKQKESKKNQVLREKRRPAKNRLYQFPLPTRPSQRFARFGA